MKELIWESIESLLEFWKHFEIISIEKVSRSVDIVFLKMYFFMLECLWRTQILQIPDGLPSEFFFVN